MPLPSSLPRTENKADSQPPATAYVCLNAFCRYRAYEKLHECPECGRAGAFMLVSDVEGRSVLLGLMFAMCGGGTLLFGLFFLVGAASGRLQADSGYSGTLIMIGIGVVCMIVPGISAIKRYTWLFWILRLLLWR